MKYILLLGGNIGERVQYINDSKTLISDRCGSIEVCSSLYETQAWGVEDQQDFLNQVIVVSSDLNPFIFLKKILNIELELGRVRFQKWAERVIDIDILFIDDNIIDSHSLKVPHPFIQERNFTLTPLVEIIPQYIHPVLGKPLIELLESCQDQLIAKVYKQ